MKRIYGWLLVMLVASMLVAACGPEMVTPTPAATPDEVGESQATTPAEQEQEATAPAEQEQEATAPAQEEQEVTTPVVVDYPVDADDWHALGSPDAPVTMVEYSDFQ